MPSPITPAPMTTVFGRGGKAGIEGVITDSLRRARPARFSGFDLSRSYHATRAAELGGTPASRQFRAEALLMQGFSSATWAAARQLALPRDGRSSVPRIRAVAER